MQTFDIIKHWQQMKCATPGVVTMTTDLASAFDFWVTIILMGFRDRANEVVFFSRPKTELFYMVEGVTYQLVAPHASMNNLIRTAIFQLADIRVPNRAINYLRSGTAISNINVLVGDFTTVIDVRYDYASSSIRLSLEVSEDISAVAKDLWSTI